VIKNKPLEDISDYKLLHDFNKGLLGNYLDGTFVHPDADGVSRPPLTKMINIIHYFPTFNFAFIGGK